MMTCSQVVKGEVEKALHNSLKIAHCSTAITALRKPCCSCKWDERLLQLVTLLQQASSADASVPGEYLLVEGEGSEMRVAEGIGPSCSNRAAQIYALPSR